MQKTRVFSFYGRSSIRPSISAEVGGGRGTSCAVTMHIKNNEPHRESTMKTEVKLTADGVVTPRELFNIFFLAHRPFSLKSFSAPKGKVIHSGNEKKLICKRAAAEEKKNVKEKVFKLSLRRRPCLLKTISLHGTQDFIQHFTVRQLFELR